MLCCTLYLAVLHQDKTFDFERKRNRPVKYDRELYQTTLAAMTRVQEIKEKREAKFYKVRCQQQTGKGCFGQRRHRRLHSARTPCLREVFPYSRFECVACLGRMQSAKTKRKEVKLRELKQNIDLVKPAAIRAKEKVKLQQTEKMEEGS